MIRLRLILLLTALCLLQQSAFAQNPDKLLTQLQSKSAAQRIAAVRQWAKQDVHLRAAPLLLAVLRDPAADVRREALTLWSQVAEGYAEAAYPAQTLNQNSTQEQYVAALKAQQEWQKDFLAAVKTCASDKEQAVRKEAVRTLARLSSSVEMLFPPYPFGICGTGIDMALSYQAEKCLDAIAQEQPDLLFSVVHEPEAQIAYATANALAAAKAERGLLLFTEFLKSPAPVWRLIGCDGIARQKNPNPMILPLLVDPDARIREYVLCHLEDRGKVRAELIAAYPQQNPALRWCAVKSASLDETKKPLSMIVTACYDPDKEVRALALETAESVDVTLPKNYLESLLHHGYPPVQCAAVKLLWKQEKMQAFLLLLLLLERAEPIVCETVVEELNDVNDPRLPAPVFRAFQQGKFKGAESGMGALASSWHSARPLILQAAEDKQETMRILAVSVLGQAAYEGRAAEADLRDSLSKLARDTSPSIRERVTEAIYHACAKQESVWAVQLMRMLLEDSHSQVQSEAIRWLRVPKTPELRQQLSRVLLRLSQSTNTKIAEAAQGKLDQFKDAQMQQNLESAHR